MGCFMEDNSEYQKWLNSFEKIKDIPEQDFIKSMDLCEFKDWEETLKEMIGEDLFYFNCGIRFHDYKITDSICNWILGFKQVYFVKILTSLLNVSSLLSSKSVYPEKIFNICLIAESALRQNKVYSYYKCLPFLDTLHVSRHLLMNFNIVERNLEYYDGNSTNDFLVYFSIMNEEEFNRHFKEEYLKILPHASIESLLLYLRATIHNEEILKTKEFYECFINQSFEHQLNILTILEDQECSPDLIRNLRRKLHRTNQCRTSSDVMSNYFEMDLEKFRRICQEILTSSYLLEGNFDKKYNMLFSFLSELEQSSPIVSFQKLDQYQIYTEEYWCKLLESLYCDVVKYSKDSIIQNLYDVSKLDHFINYIEDDIDYNILVNTNETGTNSSFYPTPCQIMDRFCIFTPKNFSHTCYQEFIYGYYQDVTGDKILSINPQPIDLDPNITKKKDIGVSVLRGRSMNYWLSMKQFNDVAYQNQIFGSIVVKTKKEDGTFIQPNCLISIGDTVTVLEEKEAEKRGLNILRLKRHRNTNIECERPPSHHCG